MFDQTSASKVLVAAEHRFNRASMLSEALRRWTIWGNTREKSQRFSNSRFSPIVQFAMLILFIAICFAAAAVGAIATNESVNTWYRTIARPAWTPPDWVFGPVWTILYLMMAISAWLVWRNAGFRAARLPLGLFGLQLALNVVWSFVFFTLQSPGWAFGEILLLWLALAATIVSFWGRSRASSLLLVPYLGWSSFAAVLNFTIWRLNA